MTSKRNEKLIWSSNEKKDMKLCELKRMKSKIDGLIETIKNF